MSLVDFKAYYGVPTKQSGNAFDFPLKTVIGGASAAAAPFAGNLKRFCIPEFLSDIVSGWTNISLR
jgi:hypothetical protein